MLNDLSIKNYALIDDLEVSFSKGFTTITGETGAGKSILLGALSMVLGKRADLSALRDTTEKCIVEATFGIQGYNLEAFFDSNDLDFSADTIIRREILPSGKSRAFINDSPVTLDILSALGSQLVDIHSQHQTLQLTENDFQLRVIDAMADNGKHLREYVQKLKRYQNALKELEELRTFQRTANKEHDYHAFLLKELEDFNLADGIQEGLEEEQGQLSNAEQIMGSLSSANETLQNEQMGVLEQLAELKRTLNNLSVYGKAYAALHGRIESTLIELRDIATEVELLEGDVEMNPPRLEAVNEQLQTLYSLQKKHQTDSVAGLRFIKNDLAAKVSAVENIDSDIAAKKIEVDGLKMEVDAIAKIISARREQHIPNLKKLLETNLTNLGMPAARFNIAVSTSETFKTNGKDDLTFQFSANKGSNFGSLKKVASGGELSRIMLIIKAILADYEQLPTMMFDEIDTGVSGEISNTMGDIMRTMGKSMQVFSITHLPQVASKGNEQFKVFKAEVGGKTHTRMKKLNKDERIVELAEMLGGKTLSNSAVAHAKELLSVSGV